jgi:hypothetical protein
LEAGAGTPLQLWHAFQTYKVLAKSPIPSCFTSGSWGFRGHFHGEQQDL